MYNVVVNILTVLIYVDVLAVLSSAHSLIFFLSLLSVSCTGLHLQPLSSTSCLCKDPATAVVSIVSVQTPWCHGIHSLLSVPPEEAGEQRTMRCHFLNPFVLFYTFFFCPTGAFFPLSSSSCSSGKPSSFPTRCFFPHHHPSPTVSLVFFLSSRVFTVEH